MLSVKTFTIIFIESLGQTTESIFDMFIKEAFFIFLCFYQF